MEHIKSFTYKKIYIFTGYHFAIITLNLSNRHCSQIETEHKHMFTNLFISQRKCHMKTLKSILIFFLFHANPHASLYNRQESNYQLTSWTDNLKLFIYLFVQFIYSLNYLFLWYSSFFAYLFIYFCYFFIIYLVIYLFICLFIYSFIYLLMSQNLWLYHFWKNIRI